MTKVDPQERVAALEAWVVHMKSERVCQMRENKVMRLETAALKEVGNAAEAFYKVCREAYPVKDERLELALTNAGYEL